MGVQSELIQNSMTAATADPVAVVLDRLGLEGGPHSRCPSARIVRSRAGSPPIAAILEEGVSFDEDRESIEALKRFGRDLPIIYIARSASPGRETAVRRLCIHYFLAHPVERDELRLVLEVLRRAASSYSFSQSFERFFTR